MSEEVYQTAEMLNEVCDFCCRHPYEVADQEDLDAICAACPLNKIEKMLERGKG